jgi:hypothetical protein
MRTKVKVPKVKSPPRFRPPAPHKPDAKAVDEPERLEGYVQGKQASDSEERMANALSGSAGVESYEFRLALGAPRGFPGWKELDYLAISRGILYAIEVDDKFTHRAKAESDRLHDVIILKELNKSGGGTVWPEVFHALDINSQEAATSFVKNLFGA